MEELIGGIGIFHVYITAILPLITRGEIEKFSFKIINGKRLHIKAG